MLTSRHGAGTYFRGVDASQLPDITAWITQFGDTDLAEVIDARWSYEAMAVALAAERHSSRDVRELGQRLAAMRESTDREEFIEADIEFHHRLFEATDNSVLVTLGQSIHAVTHLWIGHNLGILADDHTQPYPEHELIYDAVLAKDPQRAQEAMHVHMVRAVRRLRPTMAAEVYAAVRARGREHLARAGMDRDLL